MPRASVTSTCALMLAVFALGGCHGPSTPGVEPPTTTGALPQPTAIGPTSPAAAESATPRTPATPQPGAATPEPAPTTSPPGTATVQVTYARWSPEGTRAEVGAILPGLVEDDGTCTLTLTQGDARVSATSAGAASASSTSCSEMDLPGLSPGTWTGSVRYDSPTTTATSAILTIEVP